MEIVKHIDLYFCVGKKFFKLDKDKHPSLYAFFVLKRKEIIDDYNEWLADQKMGGHKDISFPRRVVYEKFMNRLIEETGVKERCIELFQDMPNEKHRFVNIMGQGFYNDLLANMRGLKVTKKLK